MKVNSSEDSVPGRVNLPLVAANLVYLLLFRFGCCDSSSGSLGLSLLLCLTGDPVRERLFLFNENGDETLGTCGEGEEGDGDDRGDMGSLLCTKDNEALLLLRDTEPLSLTVSFNPQ